MICTHLGTQQPIFLALLRATNRHLLFQQDGAPVHQSRSTRDWLEEQNVRLLNDGVWPPHSPDLNPIEHVWSALVKAMADRFFGSQEELWAGINQAAASLSPEYIQGLYRSMQARCLEVMAAKGGHTHY